jgi:biopolymer transport protein TolR
LAGLASRPELFAGLWCLKKRVLAHPIFDWEMMTMAFSTNGNSEGSGLRSEINVTPLIDVLLVMLIIFMVIVPVMPHGLKSAIPAANRSDAESAVGPVLVQVEQGEGMAKYLVDGTGVERVDFQRRLTEALARRPGRQMLVRADAELDYGVVAAVIDAGQAAGADGIGLVTPGILGMSK